ncbi:MAG: PadR family transcriptional regulator [Streptosporangiaceae bacterium]
MKPAPAGAGSGDFGPGDLGGCDLGAGLHDMAGTLHDTLRHVRTVLRAQAAAGGGPGRRGPRGGPWERESGGRRGAGHWGGGGPWGAFWPGPAGPPGPPKATKAGRGDVRAAILALLREGPLNGYQIMSEIEERSGGAWRPSPGAVYPALSQLADEGLIAGEESGGRRTFALTGAGREYIEQNPEMARGAWESAEQQEAWEVPGLFAEAARLGGGIVQIAHAGTPEQIKAAERLLAKARRDLYGILADDDDADGDEQDG